MLIPVEHYRLLPSIAVDHIFLGEHIPWLSHKSANHENALQKEGQICKRRDADEYLWLLVGKIVHGSVENRFRPCFCCLESLPKWIVLLDNLCISERCYFEENQGKFVECCPEERSKCWKSRECHSEYGDSQSRVLVWYPIHSLRWKLNQNAAWWLTSLRLELVDSWWGTEPQECKTVVCTTCHHRHTSTASHLAQMW